MVRSRCANCAQILLFETQLTKHLRDFVAATAYAPHQVYIGNIAPDKLSELPKPWYRQVDRGCRRPRAVRRSRGSGSSFMLAWRARISSIWSPWKKNGFTSSGARHPIGHRQPRLASAPEVDQTLCDKGALPLYSGERLVGAFQAGHEEDASLCRRGLAGKSRRQSDCRAFAARRCSMHLNVNAGGDRLCHQLLGRGGGRPL